jgi:hypothetical protein
MSSRLRSAVALGLTISMPVTALAQHHGNGGGGGHAPAPASHQQGGFSFPHDVGGGVHTAPVQPHPAPAQPHPAPVQQHPPTPQRPITQPPPITPNVSRNQPPSNFRHVTYTPGVTGGPYRGNFHGAMIRNPHNWGGWQWNHGVTWEPASIYWGGGFWGPFALGALAGVVLFGSIVDYQNQVVYPSYQIEPNSPGAQLLANYGLQQTPCGPPNLVAIWGPDNSVICAYPNSLVGPGNYELDPSTLTIVSQQ